MHAATMTAETASTTWRLAAEPPRYDPDRPIICVACRAERGLTCVVRGVVRLVDHYAREHGQ